MEGKNLQEAPGTFAEAVSYGLKVGEELSAGRIQTRKRIAMRLKKCRMDRKITQQALALELSMNHLTYRGYENCKSDIPIYYLIKLADYYGVSLDFLTGRTKHKQMYLPEQATASENATGTEDLSVEQRVAQLEKMLANLSQK